MNQLPRDIAMIVYKLIFDSYFESLKKQLIDLTQDICHGLIDYIEPLDDSYLFMKFCSCQHCAQKRKFYYWTRKDASGNDIPFQPSYSCITCFKEYLLYS